MHGRHNFERFRLANPRVSTRKPDHRWLLLETPQSQGKLANRTSGGNTAPGRYRLTRYGRFRRCRPRKRHTRRSFFSCWFNLLCTGGVPRGVHLACGEGTEGLWFLPFASLHMIARFTNCVLFFNLRLNLRLFIIWLLLPVDWNASMHVVKIWQWLRYYPLKQFIA